uniref:Candidate secreted effector n=1 Tax=Meloidogyne incognita TaxID=6306 RepID=A0A914M215_MELIC
MNRDKTILNTSAGYLPFVGSGSGLRPFKFLAPAPGSGSGVSKILAPAPPEPAPELYPAP